MIRNVIKRDGRVVEFDKKKILLKDPIKTVGDTAVDVRLMEGVTAKIFVSVVPE